MALQDFSPHGNAASNGGASESSSAVADLKSVSSVGSGTVAAPPTPMLRLYLASGSPRRHDLMRQAGLHFSVRLPQQPVDETLSHEVWKNPTAGAMQLAERKAGSLIQELLAEDAHEMTFVVGADTIVVLEGEVFGKPRSPEEAKEMLRRLSGKTHSVITAVSVWALAPNESGQVSIGKKTFFDEALVTFLPLSEDAIAAYVACGESMDKAGAYAAQGHGEALIASIEGDKNTVIGLPVKRLLTEFPQMRNAC